MQDPTIVNGSFKEELPLIAGLEVTHFIPALQKCRNPLLIIHGIGCQASMFERLALDANEAGFDCFVMSLRGHGHSKPEHDLGEVKFEDYVADVRRIISVVRAISEGRRVIVLGHSLGALVAAAAEEQDAASIDPSIAAWVGLASAPLKGVPIGSKARWRLPKYVFGMMRHNAIRLSARDAMTLFGNTLDPEAAKLMLSQLVPESGMAIAQIVMGLEVGKLRCPGLLIGGRHDRITPNQAPVAERLGAKLAETDCGHMIMLDPNRGEAVRIMADWLAEALPQAFEPSMAAVA